MDVDMSKIISRVKNLLDMASDANSPKEAMIAAKRARKLMDKHQITQDDISKDDEFLESEESYSSKRYPVWRHYLVSAIGDLNDCRAITITSSCGTKKSGFQGFKSDVIIATYMLDYLVDRAKKFSKGARNKNSFLTGFAHGAAEQVEEILTKRCSLKLSSGKDLIVVKQQQIDDHFEAVLPESLTRPSVNSLADFKGGFEVGRHQSLHQGVDTAPSQRLLS